MPNITFQPNKIFVRNDLLEKAIKICEATNLEFLKFKEKLGLCLYEAIYDEQELISMSEEIFTEHDVESKHLKEENEKLRKKEDEELRKEENEKLRKENKQLRKENEQLRKNNVVKDITIKEPIEIKSPEEDKNTTDNHPNWFDRNKFEKTLPIIDSNKFNYKNKIGEFKYIGIKDLVNNIRNKTISEISTKKVLNTLNEIKNNKTK